MLGGYDLSSPEARALGAVVRETSKDSEEAWGQINDLAWVEATLLRLGIDLPEGHVSWSSFLAGLLPVDPKHRPAFNKLHRIRRFIPR